ncbi:hypothetical protein GGQ68_001724 [Sagittula marina]|uniref:Uncharacterized protein n=1 Tax=Sagittula marina TaxID=943940 RepID=A0A7W6DRJ1_9RHOB|nr:hypothetical protein [Sagittula marina]
MAVIPCPYLGIFRGRPGKTVAMKRRIKALIDRAILGRQKQALMEEFRSDIAKDATKFISRPVRCSAPCPLTECGAQTSHGQLTLTVVAPRNVEHQSNAGRC